MQRESLSLFVCTRPGISIVVASNKLTAQFGSLKLYYTYFEWTVNGMKPKEPFDYKVINYSID